MTASLSILRQPMSGQPATESATSATAVIQTHEGAWNPHEFADQQMRALIRRLFSPGWPRPARQVVFCAAESGINIDFLCRRTAELLASESCGRVGLVRTCFQTDKFQHSPGGTANHGGPSLPTPATVRMSSRQLAANIWLVPATTFLVSAENIHNAPWLRARLGELRREFDYSIIQAQPAWQAEDVSLLANLCDGLVLTVEAHRTRRLVALEIRKRLLAANVRLLGVVLRNRTFPIPQRLYRRL